MQVVALPHSTTGQVQTVAQETKNCTWKISGRCWKVRHRHMPLWGGAMMQRFTTMAAAGKAFTSLDKMAVGDDSGLKSFKWPDRKRPRICVLGGGFGGLYTALRLDSLVWSPENQPQVLLIDQSERFVFKPLLYELLTKGLYKWLSDFLMTQTSAPPAADIRNSSLQWFCIRSLAFLLFD
jgi:hypothetical protein